MKIAILLVITLIISACAIKPHTEIWAPEIGGVIIKNGKPMLGVTVKIARTDWLNPVEGCPDSYHEVITDADGKFLLPADEHFSFFVVIGDTTFSWKVCADINDLPQTLWRGEAIGIVNEQDNARLKCDISNKPVNTKNNAVLCTRI
jgi:hypothetical protein